MKTSECKEMRGCPILEKDMKPWWNCYLNCPFDSVVKDIEGEYTTSQPIPFTRRGKSTNLHPGEKKSCTTCRNIIMPVRVGSEGYLCCTEKGVLYEKGYVEEYHEECFA